MQKASELRTALISAGLSDDKVDGLVKSQIEEGAVENDLDSAPAIDVNELDQAMDAIAKSLDTSEEADTTEASSEEPAIEETVEKSEGVAEEAVEVEGDDEFIDVSATLDGLVKSANMSNQIAQDALSKGKEQYATLAHGVLAMGQLVEKLVKSMSQLDGKVEASAEAQDSLLKALGQPVPPRSITGLAEVVPAPGETVEKGGMTAHSLIAKANEIIRADDTPINRRWELAQAVSAVESGVPVSEVAVQYSIN